MNNRNPARPKPIRTCAEQRALSGGICVFNKGAMGICLCDIHFNHRERLPSALAPSPLSRGYIYIPLVVFTVSVVLIGLRYLFGG